MIRVADYIVAYLHHLGTDCIFIVAGGGAMFLNDAVAANKRIKYICNQHEQASVMAADTYARLSGKLGVAMVTSGPGATNALTGVVGAWQDSTPIMIISGQSKRQQTVYNSKIPGLRQFGFLEVNIIPIINSVTKYSAFVDEPNEILFHLEKAVYLAKSGRPGPVWLDIPLDVQGAIVDEKKLKGFKPSKDERLNPEADQKEITSVIKMLKVSKKPLIIAGGGVRISEASEELELLLSDLKIPAVSSVMGTDIFDDDYLYFVGKAGMRGERSANFAIQNADLIISIGSRLGSPVIGYDYEMFAPKAAKIVVDIDKAEHKKKTIKIDKLIISDAKKFINALRVVLRKKSFVFKKDWLEKCKELRSKYPAFVERHPKNKGPVDMYFAVAAIGRNLNSNDVIVTDAGYSYYIVRQAIKIRLGQRLLIPGATGAMGFNLPGSIGAAIGSQNRRIICITGDGSLQFNVQELQTISFHKLPIKIFVMNNNGYVSIRNTQKIYFGSRLIGESKKTGLSLPDLSKIANAYGLKFYRAKNSKELADIIPKVLNSAGPIICEISCVTNQQIAPTVTSRKQPDGSIVSSPIDDMYPFLSEGGMNKIRNDLQ